MHLACYFTTWREVVDLDVYNHAPLSVSNSNMSRFSGYIKRHALQLRQTPLLRGYSKLQVFRQQETPRIVATANNHNNTLTYSTNGARGAAVIAARQPAPRSQSH